MGKVAKEVDKEVAKSIFRDELLSKNELVQHIHKALYAMDAEEAEEEFVDADTDGDDRGRFS